MIQRLHEYVVSLLEPLVLFINPYWHNFMVGVHRALAPVCEKTRDTDEHFQWPPCSVAKLVTLLAAHLVLFLFLWSRRDKAARMMVQHTVLTFPEEKTPPAQEKKAAGGLAGSTGLRHRK